MEVLHNKYIAQYKSCTIIFGRDAARETHKAALESEPIGWPNALALGHSCG
jgi:hypothetical protein